MYRVYLVFFVMCLIAARTATAHEFWIEPQSYYVGEDEPIRADLKVGQNFSGSVFAYLPGRFRSFTITGSNDTEPIDGVIGDIPAISVQSAGTGLQVLAYHSTADRLTFDDMNEFSDYVIYEGNEWAIAKHRELGLPESGFTEAYTRCAKALVKVGDGTGGRDKAVGMPLEIVALQSPYDTETEKEIRVVLLREGEPMAGQQINVFFKGDPGAPRPHVTDTEGRVSIDVSLPGRYLLNAVWMRPAGSGRDVAWESYWASLTFEVPVND